MFFIIVNTVRFCVTLSDYIFKLNTHIIVIAVILLLWQEQQLVVMSQR